MNYCANFQKWTTKVLLKDLNPFIASFCNALALILLKDYHNHLLLSRKIHEIMGIFSFLMHNINKLRSFSTKIWDKRTKAQAP